MKPEGLSIVIPCYNQGAVLPNTLRVIRQFLENLGSPYEIIAVNDGSSDETNAILEREAQGGVRVYTHAKNLGKGRAVQTGVLAARYPITLFLDADLAIPIEEAKKFFHALETDPHIDIAVASRFVKGGTMLVPVLWYRKVLENIFRLLRKAIIGVRNIEDTQCGFKMFRTKTAKQLFGVLTCHRFSFDAELLFIAEKWGIGMRELPIALQNPPRSSIRLGKDSAQMLFDLLKIRWKDARGWYRKVGPGAANITLDDFGINALVNERILASMNHPRVARIAVMAEGMLSKEEAQTLLQSGKKIDIHLELPWNPEERSEHGSFFRRIFSFLKALGSSELRTREVEKAWRRQIEQFQNLFDRLPDGINSHEHIHFYPPFFRAAVRLQQAYSIPFLRVGSKPTPCFHLVAGALNVLRALNQGRIKKTTTSRWLFSFDWGVHPRYQSDRRAEVLYHVERDEEWVHLEGEFGSPR